MWLVVIPVDPMESVDLELTFLVSASPIGVTHRADPKTHDRESVLTSG